MIIRTKHTCVVCGKEFWTPDISEIKNSQKSFYSNCHCEKCNKSFTIICGECLSKGCSCGGKIVPPKVLKVVGLPPMMI